MNGSVIEITKIVNLNKIIESVLAMVVCFFVVLFSVNLFLFYKKKLSKSNTTIRDAFCHYVNPLPMYLSFLFLAVSMDVLILWAISVYKFPFMSLAVTLGTSLTKGVKLYRLFKMAGVETKTLENVAETVAKNKKNIFETIKEIKNLGETENEN